MLQVVLKRFLPALLLLGLCLPAPAWDATEHRLMAYIAEQHLTPATKQVLSRYLDSSIAEYAVWMDRYRKAPGFEITDSWHMVTVGEDYASLPEGAPGKAAQALENAIGVLKDYRHQSDSAVFFNLLFVIHLVPETHCPGHYYLLGLGGFDEARARDFQTVTFKGKRLTYHHLWDCSLSTLHPGLNPDQYRRLYDRLTAEQRKALCEGGVRDWLLENASIMRNIYDWAQPGDSLPDDFLLRHRDLPEGMAAKASCRLAHVLNSLFDPKYEGL